MAKTGRNAPCPCGSGRKYKHCCAKRATDMRNAPLPTGRTRFEPGSYGGFGKFRPSLLCYKQTSRGSWRQYYCLVKTDVTLDDGDSATAMAVEHLDAAMAAMNASGNLADLAICLRGHGYKKLDEFRVVADEVKNKL